MRLAFMAIRMTESRQRLGGTTALTLGLIGFVALGGLMVFYVWEELNELLAGHVVPRHLLLGFVVFVALILFLTVLSRYIKRVETVGHAPRVPSSPRASHDSGG
jgi:heme A synthase